MERKPTLLWVDQLAVSNAPDIPRGLAREFSLHIVNNANDFELGLAERDPACVAFDYDYPDRRRLAFFAHSKRQHESVPMIVLTLQHSESLAVWVYRNGALDFLVKPVSHDEMEACTERLLEINELRAARSSESASHFSAPIPDDVPRTPSASKERLAPAVFYVQQHFSEHIYCDAMARLCNMSPSYFSHLFKQDYGLTFQEFLLRYRVCRACKQLQSTSSAKIADVAYSVGFSDPSYFTRVFKRYIGVVPTDYADAIANGLQSECLGASCDEALAPSSEIVAQLSQTADKH